MRRVYWVCNWLDCGTDDMTTLSKDEVVEMAIVGLEQDIAPLVAENAQLRTELATANERHAGLMLAVVDRDMIIKQYAAAMKRGEA